jgi:alpha-glucosidase
MNFPSLRITLSLGAFAAFCAISHPCSAGDLPTVASPDGKLEARVTAGTAPGFQIYFRGKKLLTGSFGVCVQDANILENAAVTSSSVADFDESYPSDFGKNNPVRNHYRELTMHLRGVAALREFQIVVRAYDDGMAYRYVFPSQPGADSIEITDEPGTFQLAGNPRVWPLYRINYTTSHEGIHENSHYLAMATNQLIDPPLLAEYDNGTSVAFAQAALRNYAGMYLTAQGTGKERRLQCDLTPLPGQKRVKVKSALPLSSPWRVMMVGTAPGRLIESDLIGNLNDPSVIADTSWLHAGKTTFYWWSGLQAPYDVKRGMQFEKDYIDYCASNRIPFHAVIGTEGDHPWYHQTAGHYSPPGADADLTRTRDGFSIEEITAYARSKGVSIRFWVHWKPLSGHLEEAFSQYEKWGVTGLMVDFLDRSDQEMVLFTEKVLDSAARHHLNIQFHGVWAPTGLSRTYPNLFNHEGVLNLEYLKWTNLCTPEHDITVAFTRMLAGPMDYHLGGFRGAFAEGFHPHYKRPITLGTRCQMLAMYVVFENPMPMLADSPDAYIGQPGFDFLQQSPTTWDETRVLSGEVGKFIVVARRKGDTWYVGAMTDWTPRKLKASLSFLPKGNYEITTWTDDVPAHDPNALKKEVRPIKSGDSLRLNLASGGGAVAVIRPAP